MRSHRAHVVLALLGFAGLAALTGCWNPFSPRVASTTGFAQQPPAPDSPVGVLRLYEWCWNRRDPQLYREIFTEDFRFQFALTDSAGNSYRDRSLTRDEELQIAENIFVLGTATEPAPLSISLTFSGNLVPLSDSRPGKHAKWHKEIAAQTLLRIEQPDLEVNGTTRFFVVRGDSALIPVELKTRGFRPDSTRWWIERIEDETIEGLAPAPAAGRASARAGSAVRPRTRLAAASEPLRVTWGRLRAFYDD